MNAYSDCVENFRYYIVVTTKYFKSYWGQILLIMEQWPQFFYTQESAFMNEPVLFIYRKEGGRQSEQSKKSEIRITKLFRSNLRFHNGESWLLVRCRIWNMQFRTMCMGNFIGCIIGSYHVRYHVRCDSTWRIIICIKRHDKEFIYKFRRKTAKAIHKYWSRHF